VPHGIFAGREKMLGNVKYLFHFLIIFANAVEDEHPGKPIRKNQPTNRQ